MFGAPRGSRTHRGIDLACYAGSKVFCPVSGVFTKYGYPYGDDLSYRYVQITDNDGRDHRFFYVESLSTIGDYIEAGEVIGRVQNIATRYPNMTQHVHYEVRANSKFVDPLGFIDWS